MSERKSATPAQDDNQEFYKVLMGYHDWLMWLSEGRQPTDSLSSRKNGMIPAGEAIRLLSANQNRAVLERAIEELKKYKAIHATSLSVEDYGDLEDRIVQLKQQLKELNS